MINKIKIKKILERLAYAKDNRFLNMDKEVMEAFNQIIQDKKILDNKWIIEKRFNPTNGKYDYDLRCRWLKYFWVGEATTTDLVLVQKWLKYYHPDGIEIIEKF